MGRLPKNYQKVDTRIEKFRAENPKGSIVSEMIPFVDEGDLEGVAFKVSVFGESEEKGGENTVLLGVGHGFAEIEDDKDFEKAESVAVGRALKHAGYPVVDDGEEEEDSEDEEVEEKPKKKTKKEQKPDDDDVEEKPKKEKNSKKTSKNPKDLLNKYRKNKK